MQLPHAFYKFPFLFDAGRMRAEIDAIPEECWRWHHEGFEGNSALPLISTNGGMNDDFAAPMMRTEFLDRMPYVMQVLAQFRTLARPRPADAYRAARRRAAACRHPVLLAHAHARAYSGLHQSRHPLPLRQRARPHGRRRGVDVRQLAAAPGRQRDRHAAHPSHLRHLWQHGFLGHGAAAWQRGEAASSCPMRADAKPQLVLESYVGPPVLAARRTGDRVLALHPGRRRASARQPQCRCQAGRTALRAAQRMEDAVVFTRARGRKPSGVHRAPAQGLAGHLREPSIRHGDVEQSFAGAPGSGVDFLRHAQASQGARECARHPDERRKFRSARCSSCRRRAPAARCCSNPWRRARICGRWAARATVTSRASPRSRRRTATSNPIA